MARTTLIVLAVVCLTVLGVVMITKGQEVGPTATIYNPYSPGILPADLDSEIARVLRDGSRLASPFTTTLNVGIEYRVINGWWNDW